MDGVPYRYSRRHGHVAGLAGPRLCEEVLRAWPEDRSQGTLVLRFRDKQGGAMLAGGGWGTPRYPAVGGGGLRIRVLCSRPQSPRPW